MIWANLGKGRDFAFPERMIKQFFAVYYNFKQEVHLGGKRRVDLANSRDVKKIKTMIECKQGDFIGSIGQLLFYEFLLGRPVYKIVALDYAYVTGCSNVEKIFLFMMGVHQRLGIDFQFYSVKSERPVFLKEAVKYNVKDQVELEKEVKNGSGN